MAGNDDGITQFTFIAGDVFNNIESWLATDNIIEIALITIIEIDGRSPYPVGTQAAVNQQGQYCGYLTSGCAETAILQQAHEQISKRGMCIERYGKGSQYIDIVLPCGSGITVLIDATLSFDLLRNMSLLKRQRKPFYLDTYFGSENAQCGHEIRVEQNAKHCGKSKLGKNVFSHYHPPATKLIIAGQGPILSALTQMALQCHFYVDAYYDDDQSIASNDHKKLVKSKIHVLKEQLLALDDPHSAFISLFHEHDKEVPFLAMACATNSFYIGALGSKTTHNNRVVQLLGIGVHQSAINKIHGPIGLKINANTPEQIAIAILAEVISLSTP